MTESQEHGHVDLLLVEDNPGDVRLIKEAFKNGEMNHTLHVVTDGEEAIDFVFQRGDYESSPRPNLVLLDLNLPKVAGMEVLETIKEDPELKHIPVIVLTGSEAEKDIVESYKNHSNACLTKPVNPNEFLSLIRCFEEFWMTRAQLPPSDENHGS